MDETHKAGAGSTAKQMCCQRDVRRWMRKTAPIAFFFNLFFYPNRILKIALWCVMLRLTTKSQWQHAICFCLCWLVRSTRGAQQIYIKKKINKKLTCGVGWWRRAETSVGHEAVKVKIQPELSRRMTALRLFYHVEVLRGMLFHR